MLRFIPDNTKIKFVNKRLFCIFMSAFIMLGTAFSLYKNGLNFGIDFSGGLIIEIHTEKAIDLSELRTSLGNNVSLQSLGDDKSVLIRVAPEEGVDQATQTQLVKNRISEVLKDGLEFRKVDYVGPQVGGELVRNAVTALLLSFAAMFVYMWFRFEWQYGAGALLALFHDAVAVIGFYSITRLEFDLTSVAAILTVVGYSINDSVVIYDRIRENIRKYKKMALTDLIDLSLNETLGRTIMTAGTTILALASLAMFGGDVIRSFSVGMLFGVIFGTYSSIYVSAVFLIYLDPRKATEKRDAAALEKGV